MDIPHLKFAYAMVMVQVASSSMVTRCDGKPPSFNAEHHHHHHHHHQSKKQFCTNVIASSEMFTHTYDIYIYM